MKALLAAIILCLSLAGNLSARYARPDLKKVPIKDLIETLEKKAAEKTATADDHQNLARAHGMAYAQKLADAEEVEMDNRSQSPWFGFQPPFVPFKETKETDDGGARTLARKHLATAMEHYEKAIKLAPDDATIRLGYGWCLEQADKKPEAVAAYRAAIKAFWKDDGKLDGTFGPVGTVEAAGYLIPLLDKTKDAKEIADLKAKVAKIEALPRAITPIAVALDSGTGLSAILAPEAQVEFDADGSGRRDTWNWITPRAAWLVYDLEGAGQIDSAIQMFGNRTFMLFLEDGYAALRLLDKDSDGQLRGEELRHLALWQDRDSNGVSDPGEVNSVRSHHIDSLATRPVPTAGGILHCPNGVRHTDGRESATFDVILQRQSRQATEEMP